MRSKSWTYALVGALALFGCAKGEGPGSGGADANAGGADAPPINFPDAGNPGTPDAAPSGVMTLRQTTSDAITAANSVACVNSDANDVQISSALNRYFRVFDLGALGIAGDFTISQVSFGVESAVGAAGATQTATLLIHTVAGTGAPTLAGLTQVASQAISIPDQTEQIFTANVNAVIPAGSRFAVEISSPDGPNGKFFFFGSNGAGESSPAYMVAPDCGITEMSAADPLNATATMNLVLYVTGSN